MMPKIQLSAVPRSGMLLRADAEFMALRGQRTGHCTIDVHLLPSGPQNARTCHEGSCCYLLPTLIR